MKDNERIIGIDILKILSMLMVLLLHVLTQGGIMGEAQPFSKQYYLSNFMEIAAYCAVDSYALISGYTQSNIKFNYTRIINLWFEVLFYNVLILMAFCVFMPKVIIPRHFELMLGPVSYSNYWYFTSYFAMYFFIPAMNFVIHNMKKIDLCKIIFAIFIVFSFLPWATQKGLFAINNGYSTIWLMSMYFIGAYIRKYNVADMVKLKWPIMGYIFCILIVATYKFTASYKNYQINGYLFDARIWLNYTSPFILFSAIFLLLVCLKINIKTNLIRKIIIICSASSFSVYLLHTHSLIWEYIFPDSFGFVNNLRIVYFLPAIFIMCLSIYLVSISVDLVRIKIFRLLGVNRLSFFLERKWNSLCGRLFLKF